MLAVIELFFGLIEVICSLPEIAMAIGSFLDWAFSRKKKTNVKPKPVGEVDKRTTKEPLAQDERDAYNER